MSIYYIYAYIRSDGTPYYIGKGLGKRAYERHGKISVPKNKNNIIIMESGLTEIGALALERRYIKWYGRKDNGTGILRNMTDGGDGVSGLRFDHKPETKNKISKAKTGIKFSKEHRKKLSAAKVGNRSWSGKSHSETSLRKMKEAKIGKKHSEDHKRKIQESIKKNWDARKALLLKQNTI